MCGGTWPLPRGRFFRYNSRTKYSRVVASLFASIVNGSGIQVRTLLIDSRGSADLRPRDQQSDSCNRQLASTTTQGIAAGVGVQPPRFSNDTNDRDRRWTHVGTKATHAVGS